MMTLFRRITHFSIQQSKEISCKKVDIRILVNLYANVVVYEWCVAPSKCVTRTRSNEGHIRGIKFFVIRVHSTCIFVGVRVRNLH